MNIALWIMQALLALLFLYTGWLKAFQYEKAKSSWSWVGDVSGSLVLLIGIVELLAVAGLILPRALMIAPILTPLAALGSATVLLFGAILHMMRKEYGKIGLNFVFLVMAVFIVVGRF